MDNRTDPMLHELEIDGASQRETLCIRDTVDAVNLTDSNPSTESEPQNAEFTEEYEDRPAQRIVLPREQVALQGIIRASLRPNEVHASSGGNHQQRGSLNIQQNCQNGPAIEVIWRGNFVVPDCPYVDENCEGIIAHPSARISRKAYEHARQIARNLRFIMHAKDQFWPDIFRTCRPNRDDIALYFYPRNYERSRHQYSTLLKFMSSHSMMLKSLTGRVELLVFPSNSLEVDSQKLGESFFMWGVFRCIEIDTSTSNAGAQSSTFKSNSGAHTSPITAS